jgi:hypothetical protein
LPVEEGGDESEMELIDDSDEGMSHPESLWKPHTDSWTKSRWLKMK